MNQARDMTLGSGLSVTQHVKVGHIAGAALGSVATQVMQMSRLPVIFVK